MKWEATTVGKEGRFEPGKTEIFLPEGNHVHRITETLRRGEREREGRGMNKREAQKPVKNRGGWKQKEENAGKGTEILLKKLAFGKGRHEGKLRSVMRPR